MADYPIDPNDRRIEIVASGGQANLAADFPIFDEHEIVVTKTHDDVDTILTLNTDYTIDPADINQATGFTVTLTVVGGAVAGDRYTIEGNTPLARATDFSLKQPVSTAALNFDFDRAVLRDQEIRRDMAKLNGGGGGGGGEPAQGANVYTLRNVAGSPNAITALSGFSLVELTEYDQFWFQPIAANTGPAQINIDMTGLKDIRSPTGAALNANELHEFKYLGLVAIGSPVSSLRIMAGF